MNAALRYLRDERRWLRKAHTDAIGERARLAAGAPLLVLSAQITQLAQEIRDIDEAIEVLEHAQDHRGPTLGSEIQVVLNPASSIAS